MKPDIFWIYFINTIKSPKKQKGLQQFNQAIKIMEKNMIVIRDPTAFCLDFDWPKDEMKI